MPAPNSRDQGGSLPIALLAAIIVAGVIVALFAVVRSGVEVARQDRDWHAAIQVADAGVQEGLALIRDGDFDIRCPGGNCTLSGDAADQGSYVAEYESGGCGTIITSRGRYAERERTAVADICPATLVGEAGVIGLTEVRLAGAFQSAPGTVVGTAGNWNFSGGAPCGNLGGLEAYEGDVPEECGFTPRMSNRDFPDIGTAAFQDPDAAGSIDSELTGVCHGDDVTVYNEYPADVTNPHVRGEQYCVRSVNFTGDALVTGAGSDPVQIFVDPGVDTASVAVNQNANTDVNFPGGSPGNAGELQIYVGNGRVEIGAGNPRFAGIIYAVNSYCQMKGTPEFYGNMTCATADMRGNFTRPSDLDEQTRFGAITIDRWFEPFTAS